MADVIDLEEARARRMAPLDIWEARAEGGHVLVYSPHFTLEMTPAQAERWASNLATLAATARGQKGA